MTSTSSSTLKSSSISSTMTGGGGGTLTGSTTLMNSTSSMMMNSLTGGTMGTTMANKDGVVLQGYHKKLKTMKKKYFVLCAENGNSSARLEYYDSERKFKSRSHPKRTIILKNCFNINRRLDTKHKYVIALSTKEEGFCIVLDSEEELNKWLKALLALQRGEDTESDPPKPTFEHVWQVQVQRKGLAEEKGIIGSYHVCLTTKSLTLVRIGPQMTSLGETRLGQVEFYLTTIRRCGGSQCYFFMEVGRNSAIGAGELWMETEDTLIAQNMYQMIFKEMSSKSREENNFGPMRKRSSSANEASKPISVLQRRQTHTGNKPLNSSPLSESPNATASTVSSTSTVIQAPINPKTPSTTSKLLENNKSNQIIINSSCSQQQQQHQQQQYNQNSNNLTNNIGFQSQPQVVSSTTLAATSMTNSSSSSTATSNSNNCCSSQNNDFYIEHHPSAALSASSSTTTTTSTCSSTIATAATAANTATTSNPRASTSTTTTCTPAIINISCNPQYPFTAPLRSLGSQRRHSVSAVCHQRALSLPTGEPLLISSSSSSASNNNNNNNINGNRTNSTSTTTGNALNHLSQIVSPISISKAGSIGGSSGITTINNISNSHNSIISSSPLTPGKGIPAKSSNNSNCNHRHVHHLHHSNCKTTINQKSSSLHLLRDNSSSNFVCCNDSNSSFINNGSTFHAESLSHPQRDSFVAAHFMNHHQPQLKQESHQRTRSLPVYDHYQQKPSNFQSIYRQQSEETVIDHLIVTEKIQNDHKNPSLLRSVSTNCGAPLTLSSLPTMSSSSVVAEKRNLQKYHSYENLKVIKNNNNILCNCKLSETSSNDYSLMTNSRYLNESITMVAATTTAIASSGDSSNDDSRSVNSFLTQNGNITSEKKSCIETPLENTIVNGHDEEESCSSKSMRNFILKNLNAATAAAAVSNSNSICPIDTIDGRHELFSSPNLSRNNDSNNNCNHNNSNNNNNNGSGGNRNRNHHRNHHQQTTLNKKLLSSIQSNINLIKRSSHQVPLKTITQSSSSSPSISKTTVGTITTVNNSMKTFSSSSSSVPQHLSQSSSLSKKKSPPSILSGKVGGGARKLLRLSSPSSSRSSTMGRDRCDSLPSTRNRTISECSNHSIASAIMPPPRTIPSRPHSIYSSRHSHSPPMSTALSPSTGCSESDGSSVSIDETDSFVHSLTPDDSGNFVSRYYNSRNSGNVIPEENADDFWCGGGDASRHITLNGRMSHNSILMDKLNNQQCHNHYCHHNHQQQHNHHQHQYQQQNSCFCNSCCYSCCNIGANVSGGNNSGCCNNSLSSTNSAISAGGGGSGSGLSLPISSSLSMSSNQNTAIRKCSPNSSNPGSADIQPNQYMEMYSPYSPCGSSPCEQIGGGHSRTSSLAEETVDGYVPMCPGQSQQEYVDMDQNSSSKQQNLSELSSAASSCSITSGTPSTDIRFAEYPLDKVKSRFTPDDEDIHPGAERPIRAYSVGSRLEHNKRKYRTDRMETISGSYSAVQDQQPVNARVRAFSVGSRAKVPRCDLYRGIFTPNLVSSMHSNNNNNSEICVNSVICSSNKGKKSSSAPILVHKSQSSVDRMSDLMEIDFSKNNSSSNTSSLDHQYKDEYDEQRIFNNNNNNIHNVVNNNNCNNSNNNIYNNGKNNNIYNNGKNMTMVTSSPLRQSSFPVNVPSPRPAPTTCDFYGSSASPKLTMMNTVQGYVEMKPGSHSNKASPSTSLKSTDNGYLEMKPIGLSSSSSKNASLSSSPVKTFSSPKVTPHSSNNSMAMDDVDDCRSGGGIGGRSYDSTSGAPDYMNVSPSSRIRSISNTSVDSTSVAFYGAGDSTVKPMEIDNVSVASGTPDGYMEMSWCKSTNKSNGNNKENDKTPSENNSSEMKRSKSRPIDIKTKDKVFPLGNNGLPLTESFSTAPSAAKLCCRSNSKDSNDIILTVGVHPHLYNQQHQQQHSTIFPFSPNSPTKSFLQQNDFATQRKCLVDATSGTVTISEEKPPLVSSDKSPASSALAAAIGLASPPQKRMNMNLDQQQMQTIIGKGEDNDIILIEETEITPEKYKILNTDALSKFECLSTTNNKVEALTNDYADMSLRSDNYKTGKENTKPSNENLTTSDNADKNASNSSGDYVNYAPPPTNNDSSTVNTVTFPKSKANDSSSSDYTIMRPSASKKVSTTVITSLSSPLAPSNLGNKGNLPLCVPLTSNTNAKTKNLEGLFKPISVAEKEEIQQLQKEQGVSSPKGGNFSVSSFSGRNLLTRNSSKKSLANVGGNNAGGIDDNGYELLHMRSDSSIQQQQHPKKISRPNSVNSEKISPLKYGNTSSSSSLATLTGIATTGVRPNSANGDCIQNQSISTSSSTSTLCGINMSSCSSSSSTLCGSKSQSPLATNSRPQSFNDSIPLTPSCTSPLSSGTAAGNAPSSSSNHEQNIPSRPPSVSSERELHYASLDLPPPSSSSSITSTPNSAGENNSSLIAGEASNSKIPIGGSSSASPSPNASNVGGIHQLQQSSFTYAQIDFNKSECLKLAMIAALATTPNSTVTTSTSNSSSADTGSGGGSSNE